MLNRRVGYRTAGSTSFPAPVGGLNDRDPLASMPKQDAVILENWWVEPSRLVVRDGYADFADGFTGPVETIAEYAPPSGVNTVFAASDGSIYDVTSGGTFNIPLEVWQSDWQGTQLLYQTARTNFAIYSDDLLDASWVKTGGGVTLVSGIEFQFTENTGTSTHGVTQFTLKNIPNTAISMGFDVKPMGRDIIAVLTSQNVNWASGLSSIFTLTGDGQVNSGDGTIELLPDGWYRLRNIGVTNANGDVARGFSVLSRLSVGGSSTYTGDGVSGFLIRAPMFENAATPGVYIPTPSSSTVTLTDYVYSAPQTVTCGQAPASAATLLVRNTTGGLTAFGTGNGSQTIFTLPDVSVFGMADVTGMTNNRWQPAQISTAGGNFLYLFNGVDDPQLYDGTSWQAVNSGSSPIAITGVTTSTLVQGCVFKNRLFMVERGSSRVWYLPVSSIGGTAVAFDLGAIFQRGGYLVGMYTWTIDAGSGADDHAVFISSEGEVVVYSGNDPSTAANWNMVGLFYLGKPIGRRCAVKFGGDLLIICETGVMPLGRSLLSSAIDRRASIVDKIQNSVNAAVAQYRNNFGWELCVHPKQNALILNIPAGENYQFVQNSISEAWTKFTGWNAITFADTQQGLLYGDSDSIKNAWEGKVDGETMVVADALQSFQSFGSPAENKYFTMVRPFLRSDGAPSILYAINGDYAPQEPTGVLSFSPPTGMIWGQMVWGSMTWGGEFRQLGGWNTLGGVYYAAALRMKVQSNASTVEWASTSFVYQPGGLL